MRMDRGTVEQLLQRCKYTNGDLLESVRIARGSPWSSRLDTDWDGEMAAASDGQRAQIQRIHELWHDITVALLDLALGERSVRMPADPLLEASRDRRDMEGGSMVDTVNRRDDREAIRRESHLLALSMYSPN